MICRPHSFPSKFWPSDDAFFEGKSTRCHQVPLFVSVSIVPVFRWFRHIQAHDYLPDSNPQRLKSGLSAYDAHRPLAVASAGQLAHNAAQKHHHEPCQPGDAADYLERTDHQTVAEHKEQCKYLHTTSFLFFKDTQNPRNRQASSPLSPALLRIPSVIHFPLM